MSNRSSSHDDTTTRIAGHPITLDEINAAYLRDNPDASATTPRPEHTESPDERKHREAIAAAREADDENAAQAAGTQLTAAMRKRSRQGEA